MSEREIDQELVVRVQQGDKKAFDMLVLKYQLRVSKLVARFLRNQSDVPDVVQDAFIKAYRALPNFRGDSAFYTWLYRIAINTAKNHLVAGGRRPPKTDIDAQDAEPGQSGHDQQGSHTGHGHLFDEAGEEQDGAHRSKHRRHVRFIDESGQQR